MTDGIDKHYVPGEIEDDWYRRWEQAGYFEPGGGGEAFTIMIPPPNVTGTLHMGHAFQDTIMDALTRMRRMDGRDALWQPGMDHAGIATQMVVERQLNAAGQTRLDLGREAFVDRVWQWKEQSGGTIAHQLRRLGASVAWSRERFTMDAQLSAAVLEVFVRLHDKGLIYRGKRLVNWDPVLHTALSDLEVQSVEEQAQLWHLRYPLEDGSGHVVVATTRPETMLGDTAVAVHPDDERYRQMIGRRIRLPLAERSIALIADEFVEREFGSGCVKITPAHDFNDYEVGRRHELPMINIFTDDATINDAAPQAYRGLDRFAARERIVADLDALGLLERVEPYTTSVPHGDRSGAVLEPYLTDQWYVRVAPLAAAAVAAVEDGRIRFVPESWSKTYYEWMRNIQDWCISRQLWWGHRIPAWYDEAGAVYVGRSEADVRERHGLAAGVALRQDEDVLDTWFSSALWPFSTLGWPEQSAALQRYYPTSVLVTGFDIIFFWVARMIMMGLEFAGDVPFREVYIHGLIRDQDGQKMSKSKGNVLDPLDLIDGIDLESLVAKRTSGLMQPQLAPQIERDTRRQFPDGIPAYGTDALRFTFAALATTGRDIRFDLGRIEGYRNFCNKLWNAARFVLLNTADFDGAAQTEDTAVERWIRSRLARTVLAVRQGFDDYRLDLAASAIYEFVWHEYCDWYLELAKPILQSPDGAAARRPSTQRTLLEVLEALLRVLHPLMPFVTEEIWQRVAPRLGRGGATIMRAPYPVAGDFSIDEPAEQDVRWIMDFVLGIRQIRGEMDISPLKPLPLLVQHVSADDQARIDHHAAYLQRLASIESITALSAGATAPPAATAFLGDMALLVPMAGLIDVEAELQRLDKRRGKLADSRAQVLDKLGNERFVARAPADIVAKERARLEELERELVQLDAQLGRIGQLRGR